MSIEKEIEKGKWPILGTKDIGRVYKFYVEKLNFIPYQQYDNVENLNQIIIKLHGFNLVIRKSEMNGPIIQENNKSLGSQSENSELVLYIPISDVFDYYDLIKENGMETISAVLAETSYLNHDFDGFYVRDEDGNALNFFCDYHGSYDPYHWDWCWEDKVTPKEVAKFGISKRPSRLDNLLRLSLTIVILTAIVLFSIKKAGFLGLTFVAIAIILFNIFTKKICKYR